MRNVVRDESGFTLTEALVAMMLMITVMFALYSIFDMSLRVFSFGNDKVEAVENARLGLEKMEREIRVAYPQDKTGDSTEDHLFWDSSSPFTGSIPPSNQITFGNDVNGDRVVIIPGEEITYEVSGTTLQRNSQPAVEFVQDVDGGGALTFEYLDDQGDTVISGDEADIEMVHVKLEIEVDGRSQILETDVALRNRGD